MKQTTILEENNRFVCRVTSYFSSASEQCSGIARLKDLVNILKKELADLMQPSLLLDRDQPSPAEVSNSASFSTTGSLRSLGPSSDDLLGEDNLYGIPNGY